MENPPDYHRIGSGLLTKRNQILPKNPRILQEVKIDGMWSKRAKIKILHYIKMVIFCSLKNLQFLQKKPKKVCVTKFS